MNIKEDISRATTALRKASEEEVWNLVRDILFDPEFGTAFIYFGGWVCQHDIFEDTYEHVSEVAREWRNRPKPFDIVTVTFEDGRTELAVVTQSDGEVVDLLLKGGKTCYRDITEVDKTGEKFEAEDGIKWMSWIRKED